MPNRCVAAWLGLTLALAGAVSAQSPGSLKQLTPPDLAGWRTVRSTAVTPDGRWFAAVIAPNEGDGEVVIRPTGDGAERRFPIGEPPAPVGFGGGGGPAGLAISADVRWAAFLAYPKASEARQLRKDRKPVQSRVIVVDLTNGTTREFPKVRRFAFAGEKPRWIALHGFPAEAAPGAPGAPPQPARFEGTDLFLHELGTANIVNVGNVNDFGFDESGDWLALTIDARDRLGNGVHLRNMKTDVTRVLESRDALYRRLQWADSGLALSLLRGTVDSAAKDTSYAVLGVATIGATAPELVSYSPSEGDGVGALRISPDRTPTWARDRSALYFGLARKAKATGARPDLKPVAGTPGAMQRTGSGGGMTDDSLPTLVIWHAKDSRLQSEQQVEESRDKAYTYLAAWRPAESKLVRLATDSVRDVTIVPGDRWAVGTDIRSYERQANLDGVDRRDVWVIDVRTGDRKLILTGQEYLTLPSPDGSKLLYYADGDYQSYEFATGAKRNLTKGLPVSFVNTEDDHNRDRPPRFPVGWAKGGASVLLTDGWDVWNVSATGARAVNLTGDGASGKVRYQRRLVSDPKERGIDLTKPQYWQIYGEWNKKSGLAKTMPNKAGAERMLWDDAAFAVNRVRDAETFVYTKQTFTQFPDYWVAEKSFAAPRRLTDANPQQREFAWSPGARLVDYVSDKGDSLQAALFLPAGYQPGKAYPTVVYIYEKLSQSLHQYATPNETRALNPSVYTSRGYAVLMPDIVYRVNDPGMSALWCVVPAVKAAIGTGIVEAGNVGLHGHSWGGYQTAFLVTQTDIFKSAIAGAALTDMVSMYSSVYWNTGTANQAIFESSQGRFKGNYLENYDAYIRNSPAFHATNVKTPVLLLHNERDGAVDFNQGITFYNTLRELGKDVVLLQYVGENHGLQQPRNQKDYAVRMREYFDHFLMGAPAPDWLKDGIPRLQMEEHLRSRQPKPNVVP